MKERKREIEITSSELKQLQKELKKHDKAWVYLLENRIKAKNKKGDFSLVDRQKIYNIFNNRLTNGAWRLVIFKHAKEILSELQNEVKKVKES